MHLSDEAAEECEALSAIYGEDCTIDTAHGTLEVHLPSRNNHPRLVVRAHLPHTYPASDPPVVELEMPRHVSYDMARWAAEKISEMYVPGEPPFFSS